MIGKGTTRVQERIRNVGIWSDLSEISYTTAAWETVSFRDGRLVHRVRGWVETYHEGCGCGCRGSDGGVARHRRVLVRGWLAAGVVGLLERTVVGFDFAETCVFEKRFVC